eukprot:318135_1
MNTNSEWIRVAKIPQDIIFGVVAMLNHDEIISVPMRWVDKEDNQNYDCKAIYKYNIHSNKWNVLIDYPINLNLKIANHAITFNKQSNKLYIAGTFNDILVIDLTSNTFHSVQNKVYCANHPILINANGTIHKIGGGYWLDVNCKHLIWNNKNNSMDEIYDFYLHENIGNISGASAVYIRSQGIILMIGGYDEFNENMLGIWRYYLSTNKWQQVKGIAFNYSKHSTTLSFNEQYVIIAGGWDEKANETDAIHVLDIRNENNYVLRRCSIKCPMSGIHKIVRSGGGLKDELLVTGYIYQKFKSLRLVDINIISLIQSFYAQESIHWNKYNQVESEFIAHVIADKKKHSHFVITLKQIICSLL